MAGKDSLPSMFRSAFARRVKGYLAFTVLILFTAGMALAILYWLSGGGDSLNAWASGPALTATPTVRLASTRTPTVTRTPTSTRTPTPTLTSTPTSTSTFTATPTPTATFTPTSTPTPTSTEVAHPARLIIPAIRLDAAIVEVSLDPDGALGAPKDPLAVGWYAFGPRPGEPGNALLTGHVDNRYIGAAVFWFLRELAPGDDIFVETDAGDRLHFVVESSTLYEKDFQQLQEVFGPTDRPAITAISCEGTFDRVNRDYSHRRVVRAYLVTETDTSTETQTVIEPQP
jgi:sortase (surface protein transpeptidase)